MLEKNARTAKKGLWVDPAPIPPWVYRKARRGQALDLSDMVPLDAETEGAVSSRGPPLPDLLDRLWKRCVKVNLRFPTVFFGSEF